MVPATNTTTTFRRCMSSPLTIMCRSIFRDDSRVIWKRLRKSRKKRKRKDRIFRQAHDCSFSNKEQIEKSEKCGCFFCGEIFSPSEITDYLPDEPPTAECPFCYTDSVIGGSSGR